MLRSPISVLLQLLKSNDWTWPPGDECDWRSFAELCDFHHVAAFVFCRLRDLPKGAVPDPLLAHLRRRFYEVSARNHHLSNKLVELTSILQNQGIPVLAYKGPALAMTIYGDLARRQFEDLDLLVRKEHLSKALDLMTKDGHRMVPYSSRCGFHFVPHSIRPENPRHLAKYHVVTLQSPDETFFLDLHWQLTNDNHRAFGPEIETVWQRATKLNLPQGGIDTLSRESLFLALCCHGAKHRWTQLKWLLDIAELLRGAETLDWSQIQKTTAGSSKATVSVGLTLLLVRDLLGIDVPQVAKTFALKTPAIRMARLISDEILGDGCSNTNHHKTLLQLQGSFTAWMKYRCWQNPGWWLEQVFFQVGPKDRTVVPLPAELAFLYHFIRPARLIFKHSRRAASEPWSLLPGE